MEEAVKAALNTKTLRKTGFTASGSISSGEGYITDSGTIFLKRSKEREAKEMFRAEYASLEALHKTHTVKVPKPIKLIDGPNGEHGIAIEFFDMKPLNEQSSSLGGKLAELHLHNENVSKIGQGNLPYTDKFGFNQSTFVGRIITENPWTEDWPTFYARYRLDAQVKLLQRTSGDREAITLWDELQLIIPKFFEGIEVKPSLIHGDLWGGNASEIDSEAVIYDPGCVFAHHEFEMGMTKMFGGFDREFYRAYYERIPKARGYDVREMLYKLFHYLNHWNHFGGSYKGTSLHLMKSLLNTKFPL